MTHDDARQGETRQDEAQMWACYAFDDFHVRVIQKWVDPYSKPMIRIADLADPERAMGLEEAAFMQAASPVPAPDDSEPD